MARTGNNTTNALAQGSTLGAAVLLGVALLGMVNYLGGKYYQRFDWTSSQLYSLSDRTKSMLEGLGQDVEAVVFLTADHELFAPSRELLERYAAASPRVKVRVVDPLRSPAEVQQLVTEHGIDRQNVIVFASQGDRRVLDAVDLAEMDYSGMQAGQGPKMTAFRGEQAFSSALLELTEARKPKIVLTTGHGEARVEDPGPQGLSELERLLGRDNFELASWASLTTPQVPEGTDLVLIAGPRSPFAPPETAALSAYLAAGGRLLLLLDPVLSGTTLESLGLETWLAGYGVTVGPDVVLDPQRTVPFFSDETFAADGWGTHATTKALADARVPVILSLARSVRAAAGEVAYQRTELLRTTADGWAETDLAALPAIERGPADVPGPVALGVAVETKPAAGEGGEGTQKAGLRMVVVGNAAFAANRLLPNAGNAELLNSVLNWLVAREALMGIPAKAPEHLRLDLSASQARNLNLLVLLVLPGLAIAAGIFVRTQRRR